MFKLTNNTKVGEGSTSKVEPPDGLLLLDPLDGFACINLSMAADYASAAPVPDACCYWLINPVETIPCSMLPPKETTLSLKMFSLKPIGFRTSVSERPNKLAI